MTLKILIVAVLIYLIWALIHHKKDKSLTKGVLLEYLLIAALTIILLLGIL